MLHVRFTLALLAFLLLFGAAAFAKAPATQGAFSDRPVSGGTKAKEQIKNTVQDSQGNSYVAGYTSIQEESIGSNVAQSTFGGKTDGYVVKHAADGVSVLWATYLGGAGNEECYGITTDGEFVYVSGFTDSGASFTPATKTIGGYNASEDAFVAKINAIDGSLVWFRYLSSFGNDRAFTVSVDAKGNVQTAGMIEGMNNKSGSTADNGRDTGFFTKLDANGNTLYSTYCGFQGDEWEYNGAW